MGDGARGGGDEVAFGPADTNTTIMMITIAGLLSEGVGGAYIDVRELGSGVLHCTHWKL